MRLLSGLAIVAAGIVLAAAAIAAPPQPIGPPETTATTTTVPPIAQPLTVSLSSTRPGVRPVVLMLKLHTELICGQPGPAPLIVKLPAAASVPASLARTAVVVDARAARAIAVRGHTVTVTPPRHEGLLCDIVAPGTVTLRFTKRARIGNPGSPGTYAVSLQRGRAHYQASFRITG